MGLVRIFTYIWLKFGVNVGKYTSPNGSVMGKGTAIFPEIRTMAYFSLPTRCPWSAGQTPCSNLCIFDGSGCCVVFAAWKFDFKIQNTATLSILTPQNWLFWGPNPCLYRFKPFHWGVQWSLGQCMKKFLGMFEKKSLWKSLSILRLRKMRNSDSKVHVRPGSSWSLFEKKPSTPDAETVPSFHLRSNNECDHGVEVWDGRMPAGNIPQRNPPSLRIPKKILQ